MIVLRIIVFLGGLCLFPAALIVDIIGLFFCFKPSAAILCLTTAFEKE
jgi:hypothetical protein